MEALIEPPVGAGLVFQYPIQLGIVRKARQSPAEFELLLIPLQLLLRPVDLLAQILLELRPEFVLRKMTLFTCELYESSTLLEGIDTHFQVAFYLGPNGFT